jgi:hypothetical protein
MTMTDRSDRTDRIDATGRQGGHVLDAPRLRADVAEVLFDVHRLEAIVEDLAVVVVRLSRVDGGVGDIENRLDKLERTFGT